MVFDNFFGVSDDAAARQIGAAEVEMGLVYDLRASYEWDRPYYEIIDFLETADMASVLGRYVFRPGNTVQLKTLGLYRYYWFHQQSTGNGAYGRIDGSVRVHALGHWLFPEVGGTYGLRTTISGETQDPTNPNFEREDEHGQWTFAGALPLTSSTTLKVTYGFLNADSDVPVGVFTRQMLIPGLEWKP